MHIAVNAHLLSPKSGYRQAGVSGYVQQLLRHMLRLSPHTRWSIYAAPGTSLNLIEGVGGNVQWHTSGLPTNSPAARILWEQLVAPIQTIKDQPDLLFCPVNVVPLIAPCRTVVTIHDLAFLRFNLHRPAKRKYLSAMTRFSVRRAAHVITVSEFTRNEVIDLLGIHPRNVTAIPNGKDERYKPIAKETAEKFRLEKQLPPQFLLFIGTLEPRKNLPTLLKAYAEAKSTIRMPLLIGGGKGWMFDEIFSLSTRLGIEQDVQFLGFIPADELPLYYATATALVYPSIYEGFGLPPLEAMAAGLPVITSDAAALREVVGEAAICFPAMSHQQLAQTLIRVATDEALRHTMIARGLERAAQFSWIESAVQTLRLLRQVAARRA